MIRVKGASCSLSILDILFDNKKNNWHVFKLSIVINSLRIMQKEMTPEAVFLAECDPSMNEL
jgi:hypothetical protein